MSAAMRRVRAHGGQFALLATLAMVAALLLTAAPRTANQLTDIGLREYVGDLPTPVRDLTYESISQDALPPRVKPGSRIDELDSIEQAMPEALRRLVAQRWYAAQTGPTGVTATGAKPPTVARVEFGLRSMSGAPDAVTVVEGHWPARSVEPGAPAEVAVSVKVAMTLGLRVGSRLSLAYPGLAPRLPGVVVAGIFQPRDPVGGIWDPVPPVLNPYVPTNDGEPYVAVALTTDEAIGAYQAAGFPIRFSWRYRMGIDRLDAAQAEPVIDAVRQLDRQLPQGFTLTRGLDTALQRFVDSLASVRALLAVVSAGVLASLYGLIALAARLAADRRRPEFALLRARGGSLVAVGARSLVESLLVIPVAVLIGWSASTTVPGRPAATGWLVLATAAAAVLALPLAVLVSRPSSGQRRDLVRARTSAGRWTLEASVLALAVLGAFLLHRRGLAPTGEVDPLLVSVPVLLAVGAAVLALRAYPWPLRAVGRLAVRARGAVAFFGMARAGRAAASTGPLTVLVIAVAVATFCGVVATGIAVGRERAAQVTVPGDALLTGGRFVPRTGDELAAAPGVRAVAPFAAEPGQRVGPDAEGLVNDLERVHVLVVDGSAFARVAAASGVDVDLPVGLRDAAAGSGPVPALVSPAVAADLDGHGATTIEGERYEFRVAAVASTFPIIGGAVSRFVVLPWQALPRHPDRSMTPTGFLLAATTIDEPLLRDIGDRGQRAWLTEGAVTSTRQPPPTAVLSRSAYRAELESGGVNGLLSFAFVAGLAGGAGLGLLAVAFSVTAGARARSRALSRLRTMGLSYRQWRGMLAYELAPLVGVSVLTGAVVGALLPLLFAPVLGLSAFTDGVPVRVRFEIDVVAGVVGLGVLALVTAIAAEAMNSRRLRLGEVLRLGEESQI